LEKNHLYLLSVKHAYAIIKCFTFKPIGGRIID
jgi:hypothetical protein